MPLSAIFFNDRFRFIVILISLTLFNIKKGGVEVFCVFLQKNINKQIN